MRWDTIEGWFRWRSGQEEAVAHFPDGARFVEVGTYLGRSICSLGEVVQASGKAITVVGIDTCRGSGPEGPQGRDYHAAAVSDGGGTFAGTLHRNVLACGVGDVVALLVADSDTAAGLFADGSLDWVHLDARHGYDDVINDIATWRPKLRAGGWLSGDDFDWVKWPSVVAAVTDALPTAEPWSDTQWRLVT